jgi:subtilisin family serine protease
MERPTSGRPLTVIESLSSAGDTRFLFDTKGNRLKDSDVRNQPRFTAPDGSTWSFYGTSAAASHVVAVAALMLESKAALSLVKIYSAMETTARDWWLR